MGAVLFGGLLLGLGLCLRLVALALGFVGRCGQGGDKVIWNKQTNTVSKMCPPRDNTLLPINMLDVI